MIGVTENYVGMLERGQKPSGSLLKLFDILERDRPPVPVPGESSAPCEVMKAARLRKGWSFAQLAKATGYKADVLMAVEEGRGQASERMIEKIAAALGLDKAELVNGGDEEIVRDHVRGTFGAKPEIVTGPGVPRARFVPLISRSQAGTLSETAFMDETYQHEGIITFGATDVKAFALQLAGDSMEPRFSEGDYAVVYPSRRPQSGNLVVACMKDDAGGDVMFKVYTPKDGGKVAVLTSYNSVYPPREVPMQDVRWMYPVASVVKTLLQN